MHYCSEAALAWTGPVSNLGHIRDEWTRESHISLCISVTTVTVNVQPTFWEPRKPANQDTEDENPLSAESPLQPALAAAVSQPSPVSYLAPGAGPQPGDECPAAAVTSNEGCYWSCLVEGTKRP